MSKLTSQDVFGVGVNVERLVQDLDAYFPAVNPQPTDTIEAIMYKSGQRSVVEYIKQTLEKDV